VPFCPAYTVTITVVLMCLLEQIDDDDDDDDVGLYFWLKYAFMCLFFYVPCVRLA